MRSSGLSGPRSSLLTDLLTNLKSFGVLGDGVGGCTKLGHFVRIVWHTKEEPRQVLQASRSSDPWMYSQGVFDHGSLEEPDK
eukprot:1346087-Amphidinium_carterae.1